MEEQNTKEGEMISLLRKAGTGIKNNDFQRYSMKHLNNDTNSMLMGPITHLLNYEDIRGKKILDVGCGFGLYSLIFAFYGADVTGIDMSKERLEVFMKLAEPFEINVKAVYCSALNLPFKDMNFDLIYCNQFISHVADVTKSLAEAKRVLKKGGILFVADSNKKTLLMKYFGKYESYRQKYKRMEKRTKSLTKNVIYERIEKKNHNLSQKDIEYLSKITMGMQREEVHRIVDTYTEKGRIREERKSIKVKFKYRHPDSGYYYERFFSPEEVKKRFIEKGFKNVKIFTPWEGKSGNLHKLFRFPMGERLARRLFISTYWVTGKK